MFEPFTPPIGTPSTTAPTAFSSPVANPSTTPPVAFAATGTTPSTTPPVAFSAAASSPSTTPPTAFAATGTTPSTTPPSAFVTDLTPLADITALKAQASAALPVGTVRNVASNLPGEQMQAWELVAGELAEDEADRKRPNDYNPSTNIKHWRRRL